MCSYHLPFTWSVITIYNQLPPCGKPGQQLNPHNRLWSSYLIGQVSVCRILYSFAWPITGPYKMVVDSSVIISTSFTELQKERKKNGDNFPHLQPIAELRSNRRGEIGRQHVKAHSCSHYGPCFDHTSPIQIDDRRHKLDRPWHRGLRPLLFSNNVTGSFTSPYPTEIQGWRRQGQRPNVTV